MDVVYEITDTITGLKYVGSKKNWLGPGTYFGSPNCRSKRFKKFEIQEKWREAVQTRPETFSFQILEQHENIPHRELLDRELFWQKKFDVVRSFNYVNAGFAKRGFCGNIYEQMTPEQAALVKAKTSSSMKKRYAEMAPEERERLATKQRGERNGNFDNKWNDVQRARASEEKLKYFAENDSILKGKTFEEISGAEVAFSRRKAISESAKKRTGDKNPFFGKVHSEETKKLMSEKHKGTKPVNTKKVSVKGVVYDGLTEAFKTTGVKATTIWHRIYSKNPKYTAYFYVEPVSVSEEGPAIKAQVAV
jgi:group I intron endonuclease